MEKINLKCRTWHKGVLPSVIKLQIPGWAGDENNHTDGDEPQPWHCPPFVSASTYGLELKYPFDTECRVKNEKGKIIFEGDFTEESKQVGEVKLPPFLSFAGNHFGMTSGLDIKVPENYVLRTEPHPAFYTDTTGTFPCCLPGHIQTYWWPKIFFVVFKNPPEGGFVIFKKGMPYGQVLILPNKVNYEIEKMSELETRERLMIDNSIESNIKRVSKNSWKDYKGNNFSDKYKQLSSLFSKKGYEGVKNFLYSLLNKPQHPSVPYRKCPIFRIKK